MKNKEIPTFHPEKGQEYYNALADKLESLQVQENDGRDVECVKALIYYLRKGMIPEAKSLCFNDDDKFHYLKVIREVIESELFEQEERKPWTS